jgi:hypothetical protein
MYEPRRKIKMRSTKVLPTLNQAEPSCCCLESCRSSGFLRDISKSQLQLSMQGVLA